ncbi:MAG: 1-acyl-sn-glycerol-3-phosphate acyltransferase [Pseudomonadota bacterium]
MEDQAQALREARLSAFLPNKVDDSHIVDVLIEERCPSFANHWTWPALRPVLYKLLQYKKALRMADDIAELSDGHACFEYLVDALGLRLSVRGVDHIPRSGRMVIASNHPTGLADGAAVYGGLAKFRPDLEIFANSDACRVNPRFSDVIIPVEWVTDKRSPAKTRETLRRADEAFSDERCVVIFPSGRLAHKTNGRLVDKDWFPTVVSLARKNKAPITPMHMKASNSALYYALSNLSGELRDITLFYELLNKQGDLFELTFGPQIPIEHLQGDPQKVTDHLKAYVETSLSNDPNKPFAPLS